MLSQILAVQLILRTTTNCGNQRRYNLADCRVPKRSTNKQHLTAAVVCAIVVCLTETEFLQKTDLCKIDPKGWLLNQPRRSLGRAVVNCQSKSPAASSHSISPPVFTSSSLFGSLPFAGSNQKATSFVTHFERADLGEASSRKYSASPSAFTMVLQRSGSTARSFDHGRHALHAAYTRVCQIA